jgi:HNH endonuclease
MRVPPPADDYPDAIEMAIGALFEKGRPAGARALAAIAFPPREIERRPSLSKRLQARIMCRDRFLCRYCGGKVIPTPIMELLAGFYPELFPYHPNWKGGLTHPAVVARSAAIDHVVPGSIGGDWMVETNLVTACWPCNSRKGDLSLEQLGWQLLPVPSEGWDGLIRYWRAMWRKAGKPSPSKHSAWLRAFEL